jgi:hypothetical protein
MSLLSVAKEVAPVIGIEVPTMVAASTEREHIELLALANEMAQRIAFDTRDWQLLKKLGTLTGDGTATDFDLPPDYKRMLKKAQLWPSAFPTSPLSYFPDSDQWLGITVQNFQMLTGSWTLYGGQVHVRPAIGDLATAQFWYISNLIIKPASGDNKTTFTADTDTFRLDERLLKLGMIWQWKANKGMAYAEDMATYEDALATAAGADKGSNILVVGRQRYPSDATLAFPGVIVS